jgi:hypothetical protein
MTNAKKKGIIPIEFEGGDGARFTVVASVKDGLIGYQVLRDGEPTNIRGKTLPRFSTELEAKCANLEYGSIDAVLYACDRIVGYLDKIEEVMSHRRDTDYCTQAEELDQVLEMLSTIWGDFNEIEKTCPSLD